MKLNRRSFVGILYDVILFEYASQVQNIKRHCVLSLDDLADAFAFVAEFYKHNRQLMDIPCDQFITRNQLHTVVGLVDYIEEMDRGVYDIFPGHVELREEAPSFASSSSTKRERRRHERQERLSAQGPGKSKSRPGIDLFDCGGRGWTDIYSHRGHDLHPDTDTDLDDEYSILIPGLSKTDIQAFLWEYAYMPEEYQDDIATLIRYLRRDEWMMDGSKGSIIKFDWGLEGVQKYTKEYNQHKIRKIELREQEEAKKAQETAHRQQEEWSRQQEQIREREAVLRLKMTDDFIWKMHKSLAVSAETSNEIEALIQTLEMEISEFFEFCFATIAAVGSFASGVHTHQNDLDLTLTGNTKLITYDRLADALQHYNYEGVSVVANTVQQATSPPSSITFYDSKTGTQCHLTINDPISIYRSKLVHTYALLEPRYGPVMIALKHLAAQRHLSSGFVHEDGRNFMPLGSYALALMLITFLQTENPPLLPKLQQGNPEDDRPPPKETLVQGIDCSFDRDWRHYQRFGSKNTKTVAELLIDFCRFFGYAFDYESKEVNARIGAFRWRPDLTKSTPLVSSFSAASGAAAAVVAHAGNRTSTEASSLPGKKSDDAVPASFHVMDPFIIGYNVTSRCQGEMVRLVKECFQEAYEALNEGDINLAFSDSHD